MYFHLIFYWFPLILLNDNDQAVVESLIVGVLAYFTAYFPLLERHFGLP